MNKRLWLNILCGFSLLCGSVSAAETETSLLNHASLGNRKAPEQEFNKISQDRVEILLSQEGGKFFEKGVGQDMFQLTPSEEMLEACRNCELENPIEKSMDETKAKELKKKATYYTSHPGAMHYAIAVSLPYGDPVQLEDGSIWSVYTGDSYKTLNWLLTDDILILPNRNPVWNSIYPYSLLNVQTGVSVQATFSAGPWIYSSYTYWIYSIDYYNCQICLNDGSVWSIPYSDSWILNTFLPGDYVTMGFNPTPGNGLGSNILINFSTMQYVYSTCIIY